MADPNEAAPLLQGALVALGMGDDPHMRETGRRVAELLATFVPAPAPPIVSFEVAGAGPVIARDIPFASLCAHHLVPFFGTIDVAYAPVDRVAGLSAITRTVHHLARRPQLQEGLGLEIATHLDDALGPLGVAVRIRARQMCVELRDGGYGVVFETWSRRGRADDLTGLIARGST